MPTAGHMACEGDIDDYMARGPLLHPALRQPPSLLTPCLLPPPHNAMHAGHMAREDDIDDYVVLDPLLEKAKGKFSKAAQAEKKKQNAWAGRSVT